MSHRSWQSRESVGVQTDAVPTPVDEYVAPAAAAPYAATASPVPVTVAPPDPVIEHATLAPVDVDWRRERTSAENEETESESQLPSLLWPTSDCGPPRDRVRLVPGREGLREKRFVQSERVADEGHQRAVGRHSQMECCEREAEGLG